MLSATFFKDFAKIAERGFSLVSLSMMPYSIKRQQQKPLNNKIKWKKTNY